MEDNHKKPPERTGKRKAARMGGRGGEIVEREQTTIRLTAELKEQLQQASDLMGISVNELVMLAVADYINRHQE